MSNRYDVKQEVTDKYSLRGRVFNRIRDDILSGKYKEGEELREVAIGEELGVSRTPVREAFRQFSYVSLFAAKTIAGKGFDGYGEAIRYLRDLIAAQA